MSELLADARSFIADAVCGGNSKEAALQLYAQHFFTGSSFCDVSTPLCSLWKARENGAASFPVRGIAMVQDVCDSMLLYATASDGVFGADMNSAHDGEYVEAETMVMVPIPGLIDFSAARWNEVETSDFFRLSSDNVSVCRKREERADDGGHGMEQPSQRRRRLSPASMAANQNRRCALDSREPITEGSTGGEWERATVTFLGCRGRYRVGEVVEVVGCLQPHEGSPFTATDAQIFGDLLEECKNSEKENDRGTRHLIAVAHRRVDSVLPLCVASGVERRNASEELRLQLQQHCIGALESIFAIDAASAEVLLLHMLSRVRRRTQETTIGDFPILLRCHSSSNTSCSEVRRVAERYAWLLRLTGVAVFEIDGALRSQRAKTSIIPCRNYELDAFQPGALWMATQISTLIVILDQPFDGSQQFKAWDNALGSLFHKQELPVEDRYWPEHVLPTNLRCIVVAGAQDRLPSIYRFPLEIHCRSRKELSSPDAKFGEAESVARFETEKRLSETALLLREYICDGEDTQRNGTANKKAEIPLMEESEDLALFLTSTMDREGVLRNGDHCIHNNTIHVVLSLALTIASRRSDTVAKCDIIRASQLLASCQRRC